jgi:hypothetical protein
VADVDIDLLDAALHAARARFAVVEVVAAVRRANGLRQRGITRQQIRDNSRLKSTKSIWLGIREALDGGFLVGDREPNSAWRLAVHPRYARRKVT